MHGTHHICVCRHSNGAPGDAIHGHAAPLELRAHGAVQYEHIATLQPCVQSRHDRLPPACSWITQMWGALLQSTSTTLIVLRPASDIAPCVSRRPFNLCDVLPFSMYSA